MLDDGKRNLNRRRSRRLKALEQLSREHQRATARHDQPTLDHRREGPRDGLAARADHVGEILLRRAATQDQARVGVLAVLARQALEGADKPRRNGGQFVSQTYRYGEEYGHSALFYNNLINPGLKSGADLKNYLVANASKLITTNSGNRFPLVGGPTPEYNGYPFVYGPYTLSYGAVLLPGVRASGFYASGNPTGSI